MSVDRSIYVAAGAVILIGLLGLATPSMGASATGTAISNQEVVPVGEAAATASIIQMIEASVNAGYATGDRPAHRDAHAKGHGCVKAMFRVAKDVPEDLRHGVFARPAAYTAWVRFSNGNGTPHDDHAGDGRGMAIKLMGVDGPKFLNDEVATQDFVMINYPAFFVADAADYVAFTRLSAGNKSNEFFATHPRGAAVSHAITSMNIDQVLEQRYFSMTPYRLGSRYIKFSAVPVDCKTEARISSPKASPPAGKPDYLRTAMAAWLASKDACFDFELQLQTHPATMPIEDPTVIWDEGEAPFIKVASMTIPAQRFDSAAQQVFCENLSFTPWHSLTAMRPAGGINRIRKDLYQVISALRHKLNAAPRLEPTGRETFDQGGGRP